ncbi:MAG: hypothetical protein MI739_11460, partial [Bacteroidales bacterium]|nr:hypothetical protein [Bacteroidales bacterium]
MKKLNLLFLLFLGTMISFSSCSKDDEVELTPEQKKEKERLEFVAKAKANFEKIVSKKWTIERFDGSKKFNEASKDKENTDAYSKGKKVGIAPKLNLLLSFKKEGDDYKMKVDLNASGSDLIAKLLKYQDAIFGFQTGVLIADSNP